MTSSNPSACQLGQHANAMTVIKPLLALVFMLFNESFIKLEESGVGSSIERRRWGVTANWVKYSAVSFIAAPLPAASAPAHGLAPLALPTELDISQFFCHFNKVTANSLPIYSAHHYLYLSKVVLVLPSCSALHQRNCNKQVWQHSLLNVRCELLDVTPDDTHASPAGMNPCNFPSRAYWSYSPKA